MPSLAELRLLAGRSARPRALHRADPQDREHYIAPIAFSGGMDAVRKAIAALPLATIIKAEGDYLYAEFRTPLLRFVDDLELLYEKEKSLLQVRSASRLGRRDFKANRKRVERLRALIQSLR